MEGPQLRRKSAAVCLISCASFGYWTPWDWDETWMCIHTYKFQHSSSLLMISVRLFDSAYYIQAGFNVDFISNILKCYVPNIALSPKEYCLQGLIILVQQIILYDSLLRVLNLWDELTLYWNLISLNVRLSLTLNWKDQWIFTAGISHYAYYYIHVLIFDFLFFFLQCMSAI